MARNEPSCFDIVFVEELEESADTDGASEKT
jgi:hypothetical protein